MIKKTHEENSRNNVMTSGYVHANMEIYEDYLE